MVLVSSHLACWTLFLHFSTTASCQAVTLHPMSLTTLSLRSLEGGVVLDIESDEMLLKSKLSLLWL